MPASSQTPRCVIVPFLPASLARPLIHAWLAHRRVSWRRGPVAVDTPHVHAPGMNPDRLLLAGDGVASGRGVVTHDLGLAGHLARSVSAQTGHATDIDIVVDEHMSVRACAEALSRKDLFRYDAVVLSLGHAEALTLMSVTAWSAELHSLLSYLVSRAPVGTEIFLLPVPGPGPRYGLPAVLARVVEDHSRRLNAATSVLVAATPGVTLLDGGGTHRFPPETTHLYRELADDIASVIAVRLDPARIPAGESEAADEHGRQRAIDYLGSSTAAADPVLDSLMETARRAFGTAIAAVTLIRRDIQTMTAVSGMDPVETPRSKAICDVTIRRSRHLVIEDTAADDRFADFPIVTAAPWVRSYAGYPIESPEGHRVGALCVMHTEPRHFSPRDLELLRTLAQLAQERLWQRVSP